MTVDEMLTDFYAHYYADNPKAQETIEDDDFDLDAELARVEAEDGVEPDVDDWEELTPDEH